ncbi:MAG TPA: TetR/AcrR family transcriptional regulator [Pirellulales bacterium]|nr:TetR/AcrR family transcriptional regulator [Pirellulales bacterium]
MAVPRNNVKISLKRPQDDPQCAARREEILTQAARLFAERGYDKTDTTLLAETVGVGKGTVYRHFPSKRELFLAAADRVMRMLCERIDARMAQIEDPLEQLINGVREFLSFFAEHPGFVELLIQERALFRDRKRPTFIEHREMNAERWQAFYRDLMAQHRVRDIPAERITDVLGSLLYGTIFMNYFSGRPIAVDVEADNIIDIVFRGILTPQELKRRGMCAELKKAE